MARMAASVTDPALLDFMLDTDPALRWHVERDIAGEPEAVWQATRARVATEGFGAQLLAHQGADGQWAGGSYFPSDFSEELYESEGQPWTATTWSLNALREWGLPAEALAGTAEKLAANSRWDYNDGPYWDGEVDACINAYTLSNGVWLGADVSRLADWFPAHVLSDGGWNCEWVEGSTRSSFHSTLNSLRGILDYEIAMAGPNNSGTDELRAVRRSGEEYLLERHLVRTLTTGEQPGEWVTRFAYPFRWAYSALKAVDYLRAAALHDGTAPDLRIADAIAVIRDARQPDGTWFQGHHYRGREWFPVDVPVGERSPWLTFYATRALDWWDSGSEQRG